MSDTETLDRFTIAVPVVLRLCRAEDLPALEWMGLYAADRAILARAFAAQEDGRGFVLLGMAGGFPVAQVIVDLPKPPEVEAYFWAVRTFFALHGLGIGRRLMTAAEKLAASRGARSGSLQLEAHDETAQRFYEKLGWARVAGTEPVGIMRKALPRSP